VRDLQPQACIFGDAGPDVRWVGNEKGIASQPCWATLNQSDFIPGEADPARLGTGDRNGADWVPAECDVSIRPGWFYHPAEDDQVRSAANLFDLYFRSVGRGASLLLNLPPDRRGQIHKNDARALAAFQRLRARTFDLDLARSARATQDRSWLDDPRYGPDKAIDGDLDTYWHPGTAPQSELILAFAQPIQFNVVSLREYLSLGQRIEGFALESWQRDGWRQFAQGTSIGSRRLLRISQIRTDRLRLRITRAPAGPALAELGLFAAPVIETNDQERDRKRIRGTFAKRTPDEYTILPLPESR
jgi:alpha-L-fucosidase